VRQLSPGWLEQRLRAAAVAHCAGFPQLLVEAAARGAALEAALAEALLSCLMARRRQGAGGSGGGASEAIGRALRELKTHVDSFGGALRSYSRGHRG
jgi:hypothetical protein